jgi:ubiquitin carboxyl-terminal hydrolase 5/13
MASVIQTLFALPKFQTRYGPSAVHHWDTCPEPLPAGCIDCQMHKLADGLLSGRYSHPASHLGASPHPPADVENQATDDSSEPVFQNGLKPSGFKALIGKGHEEFSTMRQQDSEEFLSYLLTSLRRQAKKVSHPQSSEPTEVFAFGMEQKLQCGDCRKVRYRVDSMDVVSVSIPAREAGKDSDGKVIWGDVSLAECLGILTGVEALEYGCPSCEKKVVATK